MDVMKKTKKYYFTVEGYTEKWYLDWLEELISKENNRKYNVKINCEIQKNPEKKVKRLSITSKVNITHVFDYESNDKIHTDQFLKILDLLKETKNMGKQVEYNIGYCNFTFELWIILHKNKFVKQLTHRSQYLTPINKLFNEKFENLDEYKHEKNFKRVLNKLSIEDVKYAIHNAKLIMKGNAKTGLTLQQYKTYKYYKENPSLTIWESIEKILKDCGLV